MSDSTLEWVRIEYQPDLKNLHERSVPLGVLLLYRSPRVRAVVVLGREARRGAEAPPEIRHLGKLGLSQVQNWVSALGKEAQEAIDQPNPFEALASKWRWNLCLTDPEPVHSPAEESEESFATNLVQLGQRLYQNSVKEPFEGLPFPQGSAGRASARLGWVSRQLEALAAT